MVEPSRPHPYERSAPLQVVMIGTFLMTFVFLSIDGWDGRRIAAVMSFAWFLVAFTLYQVCWLLHGHTLWRRSLEPTRQADLEDAE